MFDDIFSNIRLNDVADIAILYFLIYRLLLLIRGTRAFQMAWGLLILIPMYMFANFLELFTLIWILDKFSVYLVLAIIILFQDDIRRALARVGNPFFPHLNLQVESAIVEEIIHAVFSLASRKVGALIALEREGSLADYVEVGVRLDAEVTHELIQSIFQETSPIHDGAIVLQKNRVAAAGCFLPLTTKQDVSKALGTRHRAAIGLTDETDAVVLVVSEEEGRVSVVQGGRIRVMPDANALRQVLLKVFRLENSGRFVRLRKTT